MIDRVVDKVELASVADAAGLIYPRTWSLATISEDSCASEGPFVLKARMGRGSRGQKVGLTLGEVFRWQSHFSEPERWIVQEQVPGTEFGIDVINDLSRAYRATFQRRKHQMRDGQTAVATSVKLASLDAAGESLSKVLGHQGCADVDLMVNGSEVALLDVNVRFGGGYMFSHAAGADLPAALIAWARGGEPPPESLVPVPGLTFARTSRIHAFGGSG
jgi:carbamoyl-phosphate synthase large subunit